MRYSPDFIIVPFDAPVVDEEKLKALIVLFADRIGADELFRLITRGEQ